MLKTVCRSGPCSLVVPHFYGTTAELAAPREGAARVLPIDELASERPSAACQLTRTAAGALPPMLSALRWRGTSPRAAMGSGPTSERRRLGRPRVAATSRGSRRRHGSCSAKPDARAPGEAPRRVRAAGCSENLGGVAGARLRRRRAGGRPPAGRRQLELGRRPRCRAGLSRPLALARRPPTRLSRAEPRCAGRLAMPSHPVSGAATVGADRQLPPGSDPAQRPVRAAPSTDSVSGRAKGP